MVKINKSSNKELFNLALYNQKNKNFSVAINLYQKLIEINPNIAIVYYNLGLIYEKLENSSFFTIKQETNYIARYSM